MRTPGLQQLNDIIIFRRNAFQLDIRIMLIKLLKQSLMVMRLPKI